MALPNTTRLPLVIEQGKTFKFWWAVRYLDGTIADLAAAGNGYTNGRFQVRDKPADQGGVIKIDLTTANGGVVIAKQFDADVSDPNRREWSGYLFASAATTGNLTAWGLGLCELVIDNGAGDVVTVLKTTAILEEAVIA